MQKEIDQYLELLRHLDSPVYYSTIFVILFNYLFIVVFKYFILPLKKKHLLEKKELETDNLKMLDIFSEYDPNPIIRINEAGVINDLNRSAKALFSMTVENQKNIKDIIPEINIKLKEEISKNSNIQINTTFSDRHFSVNFYGISSLNQAQIYFIDITERANQDIMTQESEKKFRSLSFYLQDLLEVERQRIGMELHDVIGQSLFLLKLKFEEASKNYDDFKGNYNNIIDSLNSTIYELRNIMYDLKPKNLEDLGLDFAVRKLSEHISTSTRKNGNVEIIGKTKRFEKEVELYLYRIIYECLSNIVRHSQASEFNIQLLYSENNLKIYITDNGIGFKIENVDKNNNYGLLNISERIKTLKGTMKINSSAEGTLLLFEIPS
jgi:two-component system, NarL family, sensor kinase